MAKSKKPSKPSKRFKVGLGITTYNRPDYLARVLEGVASHLLQEVDTIWVYDDGSTKHLKEYDELYASLPPQIKVHRAKENKGVGPAKNWLLQTMLDEGCYVLFLGEDDIIPVDKKAIRGYIQVSRESGISHFMFAHHGPVNVGGPVASVGNVEMYPGCVGGWCFFLRPALEDVGLHDEHFHNAYEHVELTWRLSQAKYTTPWGAFADVKDSAKWLQEIPESIEQSSIRKTDDWALSTHEALEYWHKKDPNFPLMHTLENSRAELERLAK